MGPAGILESDHVDYLVWRYLQERGYGHAAVELQRAWKSDPQALSFATGVAPHTLISVVQDGLLFDELSACIEREKGQRQGEHDSSLPRRYAFLEDVQQRKRRASPWSDRRDDSTGRSDQQAHSDARKRLKIDINGARGPVLPTARAKSLRQAGPPSATLQDVMDVDRRSSSRSEAHLAEDEDTPVKEEPPPPPSTLELGHSTGIQSEPVIDKTVAKSLSIFCIPGVDIIHATWDRSNDKNFTLSGGSIFKNFQLPANDTSSSPDVEPRSEPIIQYTAAYYVTARSETASRSAFALKIESSNDDCCIQIVVKEENDQRLISTLGDITLFLRWNPSGTCLLASSIAKNNGRGLVHVWRVDGDEDASLVQVRTPALDGLWLDDDRFAVSGDGELDIYRFSDGAVTRTARIDTDKSWDTVRFNSATQTLAISCPEERSLGILDLNSALLTVHQIHEDDLTGMEWQPQQTASGEEQKLQLLATSSLDGTVKMWSTQGQFECVETFVFDPRGPVLVLSFSQDGHYLAAASTGRLQVWEAKVRGQRVAHWIDPELANEAEQKDADGAEDDEDVNMDENVNMDEDTDSPLHTLAWSNDQRTLAYTCGNKAGFSFPSAVVV